jgi:hypothetical protein
LRGGGRMSYSKLSILKPGQTFRVGECLCILLEHGKGELEGTTKVLIIENTWTTQPVMMEQPFDAHESNYKLSELRKDIESWDNQGWIEDQVGTENLVEHTVSLTTVDGQDDYGELTCKVRPITFDEVRKYNNLIASSDNDSRIEGYWTCTAWSVPRRTGEYRGDFVASVTYNGMIGESNSWDCYDVRLVCILKSDINVWID